MDKKRYIFEAEYGKFWKYPVYLEFEKTEVEKVEDGKVKSVIGKGDITVSGRSWIGEIGLGLIIKLDNIVYYVKDFLNIHCNTAFELPTGFEFKIKEIVEVED